MEKSRATFEREFGSYIEAAYAAGSKSTAKYYLNLALHMIDNYENIPSNLIKDYQYRVYDAARDLDIDL